MRCSSMGAVAGAAGYAVYLAYADPATEIAAQPYLELSPDPVPLQPGDLVLLSRKVLTLRPEDINPRVWGAKEWTSVAPGIVSNKANDPPPEAAGNGGASTPASRARAASGPLVPAPDAGRGARIEDIRYFAAGLTQSYYEVLRPGRTYRWRARLRASRPSRRSWSCRAG